MKIPNGDGYDIVVWQKREDSPTFCCGYTTEGVKFLRTIWPEYTTGKMELQMYPQEFFARLPKRLKVGGMTPGTRTIMLISGPPLQ